MGTGSDDRRSVLIAQELRCGRFRSGSRRLNLPKTNLKRSDLFIGSLSKLSAPAHRPYKPPAA
jgi:hypothetical protein